MNIAQLADFLLYCTLINYVILLIWFFAFTFAKSWMKKLHRQWFNLSDQNFDAIHYSAMAVYKIRRCDTSSRSTDVSIESLRKISNHDLFCL